jgi:hypothetical protein
MASLFAWMSAAIVLLPDPFSWMLGASRMTLRSRFVDARGGFAHKVPRERDKTLAGGAKRSAAPPESDGKNPLPR